MQPDARGYFGEFGGKYVPETLMGALEELEQAWAGAASDAAYHTALDEALRDFVGRETPLYFAERLTRHVGGARLFFKREDLAHTGAHKINNAMGQVLLAAAMGKPRIIAETGAGQHGVATAAAAARQGLECDVYMGSTDVERQRINVQRMELMGARVIAVDSGSRTLKDAINEAIRDWVTNIRSTHYLIGSAVGPHPYPLIVRELQAVIGRESRRQIVERVGKLPDVVLACVGGGSNAIGMFHGFLDDAGVALVGVEAAGSGPEPGRHAATLVHGRVGVLHGARSFLLHDDDGQIVETHSVSAGLDYPGVGPEHAWLKQAGRVEYRGVSDADALAAFRLLCETEGIIPALETAHAIAEAVEVARRLPRAAVVLINLSGRGDKDLEILARNPA